MKRRCLTLGLLCLVGGCEEAPAEPLKVGQARQRTVEATDHALVAFDHTWNFATSLRAIEGVSELAEKNLWTVNDDEASPQNLAVRKQWLGRAKRVGQAAADLPSVKRTAMRLTQQIDPRARPRALRQAPEVEFDEMRAQLKEYLAEKVFVQQNVEKVDGEVTTYLLKGELFCSYDPSQSDDEGDVGDFAVAASDVDEGCQDMVDEAKVRLVVRPLNDEGVHIEVKIGQKRHTLITVELEPTRIAETVDFAQAVEAWKVLAKADGEEAEVPAVLKGVQTCEVETPSDQLVNASCSLTDDFQLEFEEEDAGQHTLRVQAADPLINLQIDAKAKAMAGGLALNNVDYAGPLLTDKEDRPRELAIHLDGLGGESNVREGDEALAFTGLNAGKRTSFAEFEGKRIAHLDLNPNDSRRFNLTIVPDDETNGNRLTFSPALSFNYTLDQSSMVSSFDIDPATVMQVYEVKLDGDARPELLPYWDENGESVVKVVRGHFILGDHVGELSVEAGQCLLANPDEAAIDPASHVSELVAGTCPAAQK